MEKSAHRKEPITFSIRPVRKTDDLLLGAIIRGCFLDYEATQQGTVFSDSVIDRLSEEFDGQRKAYFVLELEGKVMGGSGIQQLKGAEPHTCELQKMYLKKEARGRGLGRALLDRCLAFAKQEGFTECYLESLPELNDALKMYERAGFRYIPDRKGQTGYYGCTRFMLKAL
ncbi:MAG: GNAT family N-acetyltransferase [Bacteroidales bacterium]|nr:GNAT family N-acetyltransferase [Bacteroidales bacterium]